jgi:hypothetical protein
MSNFEMAERDILISDLQAPPSDNEPGCAIYLKVLTAAISPSASISVRNLAPS